MVYLFNRRRRRKRRSGGVDGVLNSVGSITNTALTALATNENARAQAKGALTAINGLVKARAKNRAIKKSIKARDKFLEANPHIKLQMGINARNAYIDSLVGNGAHNSEAIMKSNYNAMKRASGGGPIKLQGVKGVY